MEYCVDFTPISPFVYAMTYVYLCMARYIPLLLPFFFVSFLTSDAFCQNGKPVWQPDVMLIQLSSEHNRMQTLRARGDRTGMLQLNKDIRGVFIAIRNDFRDHFTACPVYYFIDTNLARVKAGRLNGVLIDTGGNILKGNPVSGKEFQVAYYGYPKARIHRTGYLRHKDDDADFDTKFGRVWVVCDRDMNQVAYSKPRPILSPQADAIGRPEYKYTSPRYNIEYRACADRLQKAMLDMGPR